MSEFNFNPHTTSFNLQNAYCLALASNLAYKDENEIKEVTTQWGFEDFRFFSASDDTQGFIISNDDSIIVSFRGTEPTKIEDWITDLKVSKVDGPLEGEVHDGFYSALANVWQKVERTIARFRNKGTKSLWFTGHSLGAAIAALAVAKLIDEGQPVDGLYTYGQPRVGNRRFARNFNFEFKECAFRFVNNNDVVTRVAPRISGYRHMGTFKYFTEDGVFMEDISAWNRFLDRLKGRFEDILEWGTDGIKDHSMDEYVARVKKALENSEG